MSRSGILIRKYAILCHRWMGVVFCVLFAAWFLSGIVLMYWEFPVVAGHERLAHLPPLDASRIQVPPEQAFQKLDTAMAPSQVWISMLGNRPVYRFQYGRSQRLVYADNGDVLPFVSNGLGLYLAAAWLGQAPGPALATAIAEPDQWTVYPEIRRAGPFWKYSWPNGEDVYVSQSSGEIVQHTTRSSRLGAWLGAIPHWLYFTPLRRNTAAWRAAVIGLSGGGILATIFGLVAGVWLYSPSKRYRFPNGRSSIPYAGQKHWHTMLGLIFGLFALTWIFSGMLSMNPLQWSPDSATSEPARALRGQPWSASPFMARQPREALAKAPQIRAKELELAFIAGEPVYLATEAADRTMMIPVAGDPSIEVDPLRITRAMTIAGPGLTIAETRRVTQYEPYYIDRHHAKPLPVLFVRLNDREQSIYYVDLRTAQVVESYDGRSRLNRWLYHGLHSMDLPWLYRNRPAWDITVLTLMIGGNALCITSLVIGWRRVRKKIRMHRINVAMATR